MTRNNSKSEYLLKDDGTEVCPECGHLWSDYTVGHYHDCRYFVLEDAMDEDLIEREDDIGPAQLSLFRPAA